MRKNVIYSALLTVIIFPLLVFLVNSYFSSFAKAARVNVIETKLDAHHADIREIKTDVKELLKRGI